MDDTSKKKRKVKPTMVITIVLVAVIVFGVLWLFTPFGFWGVEAQGEYQIQLTIGETEWTATMENNTSSWTFHKMLERGPKTVNLRDYGGMEKVGMLWKGLPTNNEQITASPGDIILFMGSSVVVYYNQNSWDFTRLGHINDVTQEELKEVLGTGNVTITFELINE